MTAHAPLPHDSTRLLVTGEARYTDDIPAPAGALHLAFGLSTQNLLKRDAADLAGQPTNVLEVAP